MQTLESSLRVRIPETCVPELDLKEEAGRTSDGGAGRSREVSNGLIKSPEVDSYCCVCAERETQKGSVDEAAASQEASERNGPRHPGGQGQGTRGGARLPRRVSVPRQPLPDSAASE